LTKRVRILFFTDYFRPEPPPPAHHIAERATLWCAAGHEVTIVTNHPNYPEGRIYPGHRNRMRTASMTPDGVRLVRVWTYVAAHDRRVRKLLDQASYAASATLQALREPAPDVVVATTPHLFAGLAGALYARATRRPLLLEVRDLWPDSVLPPGSPSYRVFKRLERFLYRSSAAVSVMTPKFEPHVRSEGAKRVVTVVGGVDCRRFSPGPKPASLVEEANLGDRFVIGYPGTLGTAHDLRLIADVGRILAGTRVVFLFIGGGPHMERLRALTAAEFERFRFVSTQPPERMGEWWRTMDAGLVLLRNTEAMRTVIPSKIFEAMASGKPTVFVGPRGAGSAVVDRHDAGIVLDGDAADVAEGIRALVADRARCEALGANAFRASESYGRDRHAAETLALLQEIAAGGAR
jgi:glycosyltransferase involved in cell wall biosynthesis